MIVATVSLMVIIIASKTRWMKYMIRPPTYKNCLPWLFECPEHGNFSEGSWKLTADIKKLAIYPVDFVPDWSTNSDITNLMFSSLLKPS